jgi:DNA-binding NarL/FixJ family response regulator
MENSSPKGSAARRRKSSSRKTQPRSRVQSGRISLMLVDDHPMWRQTLRNVLEHGRVGEVVAEASDGEEAIEAARKVRPDVVIMDIELPKISGIEATKRLTEFLPGLRVLILSASDEKSEVIGAIKAGATGYLLKTAIPSEVADAVSRILKGELVLPPSLAEVVVKELTHPSKMTPLEDLTEREREVLSLMAEGRSNQAISQQLFLTSKTVEAHVRSIFMKLGLEPAADDHRRVLAVLTYLRSV